MSKSKGSGDKPVPDTPLFNLGDVVRHKCDPESRGMVTGLVYRFGGSVQMLVSWPAQADEQVHYSEELKLVEDFEA